MRSRASVLRRATNVRLALGEYQPCSVQVMGAPDVGCVDEAAGARGERRRYRVPTKLDAPGEGRAFSKLVPSRIEALPEEPLAGDLRP